MMCLYCLQWQAVWEWKLHLEEDSDCWLVLGWCYCCRLDSNSVVSLEAAAATRLRTNALRVLNECLAQ